MKDWRARNGKGVARVRMYYDTHPSSESRLTLDSQQKNRHGDPLPKIVHRLDEAVRSARSSHATADSGYLRADGQSEQLEDPVDQHRQLSGPSCRRLPDGNRPEAKRVRQLRPNTRSSQPVRDRRADSSDRRVHKWNHDLRWFDPAERGSYREDNELNLQFSALRLANDTAASSATGSSGKSSISSTVLSQTESASHLWPGSESRIRASSRSC